MAAVLFAPAVKCAAPERAQAPSDIDDKCGCERDEQTHIAGGIDARIEKAPEIFRPQGLSVRSLAVTYSGMPERHTTIGAERFHFRVRNGIGWFPLAMAARQTVRGSRDRCCHRPRAPLIRLVFCFNARRVHNNDESLHRSHQNHQA